MANIYEGTPELEEQARANQRKRMVAEMLMQQAQQPVRPYASTGRMVAPMSWTQGLAQLAQAYFASKGLQKSDAADADLAKRLQTGQEAAAERYRTTAQGRPEIAPPMQAAPGGVGPPSPGMGPPQPRIEADPRGAVRGAMMDPYASPGLKQAAAFDYSAEEADRNRAADLAATQTEHAFKYDDTGRQIASREGVAADNRASNERIAAGREASRRALLERASKKVPPQVLTAATNLMGSPEYKEVRQLDTDMLPHAQYLGRLKTNTVTDTEKAVGDLALVKSYMKIMDPANSQRISTMTENDIKSLRSQPDVLQRYGQAVYNFVMGGPQLTDGQRREIWTFMRNKQSAARQSLEGRKQDTMKVLAQFQVTPDFLQQFGDQWDSADAAMPLPGE